MQIMFLVNRVLKYKLAQGKEKPSKAINEKESKKSFIINKYITIMDWYLCVSLRKLMCNRNISIEKHIYTLGHTHF